MSRAKEISRDTLVLSISQHAFQPTFRPNVFVDIRATLETKAQAMELYESEVRAFAHPRSSEALQASARRWASAVGLEAAEAFELVRSIRSEFINTVEG